MKNNGRRYGSEVTHITLTEKAQRYFDENAEMGIREYSDWNDAGEIVYSYTLTYSYATESSPMTAEQLNTELEILADEQAAALAEIDIV